MDQLTEEQQARVQVLRERLGQRDITADEVREYLWFAVRPEAISRGVMPQDLNVFVTDQSLVAFWWLVDWWSEYPNPPHTLLMPTLEGFCGYYGVMNGFNIQQSVERFYGQAQAYVTANNLKPQVAGESKEETRKRKHAERMKAARDARRVSDKRIPDEHRDKVRELEAQRDNLRREQAEEDARLKAAVLEHQAAMIAASNSRKTSEADYKNAIQRITDEIRQLTS